MIPRAYPIPQPDGDDHRFNHGLIHDIGKVLESHGFPPVKNGTDAVDLMMSLYRFVYASEDRPVPADEAPEKHMQHPEKDDEGVAAEAGAGVDR